MLLKDTSLISIIGGKELVYAAQAIYGRTYEQMYPLLGVALIYLIIVMIFTWLVDILERRLRQSDRR
jgi:ABC-type amino acid transport system permease subunit